MPRLEYNLREISSEGRQSATVIEVSGSVDPDTLEIFETMFDELIDEGKIRLALDLERLKYINSTGMGMMVQVADTLTEQGGGMVLLNIQPKVMLVLEMLGLQQLFAIVNSDDEALAALEGEDTGPSSIQVHLEGAEEEIPEPVGVIEEYGEIEAQEIQCPACSVTLSVPGPGAYRCPRCRVTMSIDENGGATAFSEAAAAITEMTIPAQDKYFFGAASMVSAAALSAGIEKVDAQKIATATTDCLKLLLSDALGEGSSERLHLFLHPADSGLTVHIYCNGNELASVQSLEKHNEFLNKLEYKAVAEGNLITLEKLK